MEFKIGQRVICTESHDDNFDIINRTGKIIAHISKTLYGVEFDKEIEQGHDCGEIDIDTDTIVRGKYGYCWNIRERKLKLYNKNKRVE
jgi:hypothetical protein